MLHDSRHIHPIFHNRSMWVYFNFSRILRSQVIERLCTHPIYYVTIHNALLVSFVVCLIDLQITPELLKLDIILR